MGSYRNNLLQSIACTIADYRQGEIEPITSEHVDKWLKQFDIQDQMTILIELDLMLKRFYFSQAKVKECYRNFLAKEVVGDRSSVEALTDTEFLLIQEKGESQKELWNAMDEVVTEKYHLSLNLWQALRDYSKVSPQTYIYIDDAIYTGNRVLYDLTEGPYLEGAPSAVAWIPREAPEECNLVVYTLASHAVGYEYISPLIKFWADKKRISVRYCYDLQIDNRRSEDSKAECL